MERIFEFLPSLFVLALIAYITRLYIKETFRRYGENLNDVDWLNENQTKVAWTIGTPMINIWAPVAEELIFRAPIIIAFGAISGGAWYAIVASGLIFGLIHWFGIKISFLEVINARDMGKIKTNELDKGINQLAQARERGIVRRKVVQVVFTSVLGVLAGYYGILYQSIWVAVGIHFLWNLFMPILLIVVMLLVGALFDFFQNLFLRRRRF